MNMVRSMLSEKQVPKNLWPEAINWTAHVLNRSPTLAVKDMTPEEAWSGVKPDVDYFRVFGCIGHVHVLDSKRKKLDDKSFQCVLLGMSEEFKAYRLYDPASKKIVVSRDVVLKKMSVGIGEEVMKKQDLISSSGEIVMKKEVNMIKVKKNLKRRWQQKKKNEERLAYLQVSHLERILQHLKKAHQKGGIEEYHYGWKIM
jgi:hypothetical protein